MTLKLEVGKSYKTRGRWKATIIKDDGSSTPYRVSHHKDSQTSDMWHYQSGLVNTSSVDYDLVSEWGEEKEMIDLTKIEKPFGLLDKETQERLKAHKGVVQYYFGGCSWSDVDAPTWYSHFTYRAKPFPVVTYNEFSVSSRVTGFQYFVKEKFIDGKYDSYTTDMVPF